MGWAAEEWEEVAAGREVRVPEAEARELEALARVEVRVPAAEVCGKPAPAAGRALVVAQVTVVARVQAEDRDQAEAALDRAEVARELDRVGAEEERV